MLLARVSLGVKSLCHDKPYVASVSRVLKGPLKLIYWKTFLGEKQRASMCYTEKKNDFLEEIILAKLSSSIGETKKSALEHVYAVCS